MNLNWSNREGRVKLKVFPSLANLHHKKNLNQNLNQIGVTMKDVSLAFWDWSDQFSYQKSFSVSQFVTDYQSQIWYLDIF